MEKTPLTAPDGLYKFHVMPFSPSNAPATFEHMVDTVPHGYRWYIYLCNLYNVAAYSSDFPTHLKCL